MSIPNHRACQLPQRQNVGCGLAFCKMDRTIYMGSRVLARGRKLADAYLEPPVALPHPSFFRWKGFAVGQ